MNSIGKMLASSGALLALLVASGCATSPSTTETEVAADAAGYRNLLIIGIGEDYEGRTRFERRLSNDLKDEGVTATPMYVAAGGNVPISREQVVSLIDANAYDAVLIARVLASDASTAIKEGSAATKSVRREGRPLDLFRYDYEELNEPSDVDFRVGVTLYTELFSTAQDKEVWALETNIAPKDYMDLLINEASEKIVRQMRRDKLLNN
ncbi:MAG: hypothetical protein AAGI27_08060 [Pseudomonadota bacterium]